MLRNFSYILLLLLFTASALNDAREANKAYENANYEEAEQLYLAALEQEPDNSRLYFNLGNAQAKQGKVEEAIQSFLEFRSLADSPEEKAMAEYNIGTLMAENEEWKPATSHFKKSLKLSPDDVEAKHNYERALAQLKKEESEEDDGDQQNDENQPPPEPSSYAVAMKKQAEKMITKRKYNEAYNLMQDALNVDETVRAFDDFIKRIKNVDDINQD